MFKLVYRQNTFAPRRPRALVRVAPKPWRAPAATLVTLLASTLAVATAVSLALGVAA